MALGEAATAEAMTRSLSELPLVAKAPTWNDLAPVSESALAPPEPDAPQGEYGPDELSVVVPLSSSPGQSTPVELLAPAGGLDSAFAALHYGADAVYVGLKKFSARAEAENFTLDELSEITAYAHSLTPRRRVFVTINTVIRQDEVDELIEALVHLSDIGVDAVIVQDLGVYYLLRRHFPEIEIHASTQLAVHNAAGARVLKELGFQRVVLARELTFEEVRDITRTAGVETEVFIHGALCYSYSGLCLFSSQTLGRSGNRGKCAYSCRDSYEVQGAPETLRDGQSVKRSPATGFPFSMKDLALPDHLPALRAAGVSCFKIEGRKKSPLYVATTTDYYRKLIDGRLTAEERGVQEAELQTVFSRPWTRLFLQSHRDKEVADRDTVGHRGTHIGTVDRIIAAGSLQARLRFRTERAIERHDGLQIDLPVLGKPFGFPVDRLWIHKPSNGKASEVIDAPAGADVEVALPADHPAIPTGARVYCSSSQLVKRKYRHDRPKPALFRSRRPMTVTVRIAEHEIEAIASVVTLSKEEAPVEERCTLPGQFTVARSAEKMAETVHTAFAKLGDTRLTLQGLTLQNPNNLFVPVSKLNQLRRLLCERLETAIERSLGSRFEKIKQSVSAQTALPSQGSCQWSIKVDRIEFVEHFEASDWNGVEELVVDIARDHPLTLEQKLQQLGNILGPERIRLALPALTRLWEQKGLQHKIHRLRELGWNKWEVANLSGWDDLGLRADHPQPGTLDLATDWSVYVMNRLAARQLQDMGVSRFALSPEDGRSNMRSLLEEFGARAVVIVYQDTPQFIAESCAYANLIGGCPGKANCRFETMDMVSSHGERVTALDYHCRTIVLNQGPFCLSTRLRDLAALGAVSLRADFIYRRYQPSEVRDTWRRIRGGKPVPGAHGANFDRGIQ
jgi:putative protease